MKKFKIKRLPTHKNARASKSGGDRIRGIHLIANRGGVFPAFGDGANGTWRCGGLEVLLACKMERFRDIERCLPLDERLSVRLDAGNSARESRAYGIDFQ